MFGDIAANYNGLKTDLNKPLASFTSPANNYNARLDTLNTTFSFIQNAGATGGSQASITSALSRFKSLQGKLNATEQIRKTLEARRRMLQEQFQKLGMVKAFKQFKKQVFYYRQQLEEYRNLFSDPARLEAKLTQLIAAIPAFQKFFANHSQFGNLFALPGSSNAAASLAGLQTRAMVQQNLAMQFGTGPQVQQMLQQNMNEAQNMLNQLKSKIGSLGSGSSGDEMPDFKIRTLKTKSFFQRLEFGTNIQAQKGNFFFPNTTDIGLSAGYRLSEKNVIGIGMAWKMGLGRGWNNINITHEGLSLRSYIDVAIIKKSSLKISGGYEKVYRSAFKDFSQLRDRSGWTESGLIGISKIISLKTKLFKKTKVQLLWDFLAEEQIPQGQPIVFRIGYGFN